MGYRAGAGCSSVQNFSRRYFRLLALGPANELAVWAAEQQWQVSRVDLIKYIILFMHPVASKYQRDLTYTVIHLKVYKSRLLQFYVTPFSP